MLIVLLSDEGRTTDQSHLGQRPGKSGSEQIRRRSFRKAQQRERETFAIIFFCVCAARKCSPVPMPSPACQWLVPGNATGFIDPDNE